MSRLHKILFASTIAACVGLAEAQTSDTSKPGAGGSASTSAQDAGKGTSDQAGQAAKDPYRERRESNAAARHSYKEGKTTKEEYSAEKKGSSERLKQARKQSPEKSGDVSGGK